jgi:hypothetical protein
MDCAHTPYGRDAVCGPGFSLPCGHAHSIERSGNLFIGPATSHAAHHRQCILCGGTTVFTALKLTDLEFRMLTALDRQHHVTNRVVDINDNVGDDCTQQLWSILKALTFRWRDIDMRLR